MRLGFGIAYRADTFRAERQTVACALLPVAGNKKYAEDFAQQRLVLQLVPRTGVRELAAPPAIGAARLE